MAVRSIVKPSPNNTSNIFVDLDFYSSEEEGEIVEEDCKFRRNSLASDSLSDADSKTSLVESETALVESETSSVDSWSRRGTKGVVMYIPTVTHCEEQDSDEEYTPSEELLKFLAFSREYLSKYDGMSWADIDCLSDAE